MVLLLSLTLITSFISGFVSHILLMVLLILGLSGIKFLLVAFQFMELKRAHRVWKIMLSTFLLLYIVIISIILL
ncbi:MAG: cytochrome C oxidase subunit IV family protein [Saprospiraceae bacterium]|nr:cytochrome C oxidase subunit IV family protein [Saprospiraceae bacterium]